MKIQNMRSILVGIKRTLKYNLIILSEKLMLHIILQGMRYGLLYVESNSLWIGGLQNVTLPKIDPDWYTKEAQI